jgi:hypothetical protein
MSSLVKKVLFSDSIKFYSIILLNTIIFQLFYMLFKFYLFLVMSEIYYDSLRSISSLFNVFKKSFYLPF